MRTVMVAAGVVHTSAGGARCFVVDAGVVRTSVVPIPPFRRSVCSATNRSTEAPEVNQIVPWLSPFCRAQKCTSARLVGAGVTGRLPCNTTGVHCHVFGAREGGAFMNDITSGARGPRPSSIPSSAANRGVGSNLVLVLGWLRFCSALSDSSILPPLTIVTHCPQGIRYPAGAPAGLTTSQPRTPFSHPPPSGLTGGSKGPTSPYSLFPSPRSVPLVVEPCSVLPLADHAMQTLPKLICRQCQIMT